MCCQFLEIYDVIVDCVYVFDILVFMVYVLCMFGLNVGIYGINEEVFIIIGVVFVKLLEFDEFKFVIGYECGYFYNNYVVYCMVVMFLM